MKLKERIDIKSKEPYDISGNKTQWGKRKYMSQEQKLVAALLFGVAFFLYFFIRKLKRKTGKELNYQTAVGNRAAVRGSFVKSRHYQEPEKKGGKKKHEIWYEYIVGGKRYIKKYCYEGGKELGDLDVILYYDVRNPEVAYLENETVKENSRLFMKFFISLLVGVVAFSVVYLILYYLPPLGES